MSKGRLEGFFRTACAVVVVFFACWTLLANAVVLSGNSFTGFCRLVPIVPIAALITLAFLFSFRKGRSRDQYHDETDPGKEADPKKTLIRLLIGAGLAAIFAFGNAYLIFWFLAVLYLGYSYLRQCKAPMLRLRVADASAWNNLPLAAAIIIAVGAVMVISRPNDDQTLNINMAVSVLGNPDAAIFRTDSLHGIPGAYFIPSYRVHAFELLAAWLASSLNIREPIVIFHLLLAPLLALFSICAAARCCRLFLPRSWGWGVLALVALHLILRQTYTMYGNFAYVRMSEGKSVFVTAIVPLIVTYAVEFFVRPDIRKWLLLLLAQVCAVGLTANALYGAPVAAALALAACWRPSIAATRTLGLGLLVSVYPVAVGLIVRSQFNEERLFAGLQNFQQLIPIDASTRLVLGDGLTLWLWLLALTSAWCIPEDLPSRVWMLAFSLGFLLTCMNPFLERFWGANVTANYLTWRVLWAIPLPVFLTILVVQPLAAGIREAPAARSVLLFVVLALLFTLAVGKPWRDPSPSSFRLGLKVPETEYAVAERLGRIVGSARPVLAPEGVSAWVPTFRSPAYPLVARRHYTEGLLAVFKDRVDVQDLRERLALLDYVTGDSHEATSEALLERWLKEQRIAATAVPKAHKAFGRISGVFQKAGFVGSEYLGYVLFQPGNQ